MKPGELQWFDVVVPLVRRPGDGPEEQRDVTMRLPSENLDSAIEAAEEIAWAIVENLSKGPDNNRYGWKLASYGVAVDEVRA